ELSRVVYLAKTQKVDAVTRREARTDQRYVLDAACTSVTPGRKITYELLSSNESVASGDLPCDGNVMRTSPTLPATAIQISLADLDGVTAAYAVITPEPS
ncbi:hypothetical protein, partial [Micromonospora sp. KC721]|uniref:hypothetical protein n=1 Tax=Micromonospora sp. KC721 TaxID=2530380 RepID=UPI001A9CD565